MKITYIDATPTPAITLDDVFYGTVFRPINSHRVFMLTTTDGEDRLLTSSCAELENYVEEFNHHFDEECQEYRELMLCVELDTGKPCLIDKHTYIEELDYEFIIKEN